MVLKAGSSFVRGSSTRKHETESSREGGCVLKVGWSFIRVLSHQGFSPAAGNETVLVLTDNRFTVMLFIRTKHNMETFRVIPFIKLQNNT